MPYVSSQIDNQYNGGEKEWPRPWCRTALTFVDFTAIIPYNHSLAD
jgi:hypothetical protein